METKNEQRFGIVYRNKTRYVRKNFVWGLFAASVLLFVQIESNCADDIDSNEALIQQYVQAKGTGNIVFDASNIKQFWIENTVAAYKNYFEIQLNKAGALTFESVPLKIQLANVNETQDCKIEVIADTDIFDFSILNNDLRSIGSSSPEEDYLQYKVCSGVFHLEDTNNLSFKLVFRSKELKPLAIKRIILSFSKNKKSKFLLSPGVFHITGKDMECKEKVTIEKNSFSVSGKRYELFSKNRILVGDRDMSNSVTVRNVGDTPTTIYLGYAPYTKNRQLIQSRNNPYKNGAIFKIVSAEVNSNKVIVDAVPEWEKGCHLVLNAKEDLSDFPNFSFVNGTISDVKILDNGQAEIVLTAPLKTALKKGTTARVQAPSGAMYLYTNTKRLEPGEEVTLSSQVRKDDDFLLFSPKAFCRGTYYVIPVLLSYSINKDDINKIKITNFTVSY